MRWNFSLFVIPLFVAAALSASLVIFTWRRRRARGAVPFLFLSLGLLVWTIGYILEIGGVDFAVKTFGLKFSFVGVVCVPTAWLLFSLQYSGHGFSLLKFPRWLVFGIIPLLTLILVWSWDQHQLFWTMIRVEDHGEYATLSASYGPLFYIHAVYSYAFMLAGALIILISHLDLPRPFYQQKAILILGMAFAWLANLSYVFKVSPLPGIDLTPFAFAVSGIGVVWSLFGFRFLDLIPVARELLFKEISDGIIVLDHLGRIRDLNAAATRVLAADAAHLIGKPFQEAVREFPGLEGFRDAANGLAKLGLPEIQKKGTTSALRGEFQLETSEGRRDFTYQVTPLTSYAGDISGWLLELQDITDQKIVQTYFHQRAAFLEIVNRVIAAATSTDDLQVMLRGVLEHLLGSLNVPRGGLRIERHEARIDLPQEILQQIEIYCEQASESPPDNLQPLILVEDWEALSEESAPWGALKSTMLREGIRSTVAVPVGISQICQGFLILATNSPHHWESNEIALLSTVGRQIGVVAVHLMQYEETRQRNRLMARLVEQSATLNRQYTVNEVIPAIKKAVCELLSPDQVDVIPVDLDNVSGSNEVLNANRHSPSMVFDPRPILIEDVEQILDVVNTLAIMPDPAYRAMGSWALVYEDRTLAVITLYFNQPHTWSQAELDVMQAFTRQAAIALENARLFDAEREQHILAGALRDLVTVVNSTLDYNEVLERILANLGWVLPFDLADVMLVQEGVARVVHSRGYDKVGLETWVKSLELPLTQVPVMQEIYQTGEVRLLSETLSSPLWTDFQPGSACKAYLGAPIIRKQEVVGLINVYSQTAGVYLPRHAETLRVFSNQVAIALENARLYAELQERADETSALYRAVTRLFTPGADLRTLAGEIVEAVTDEFKSDHCSLLLYDESTRELKIVAQSGYEQVNPKRLHVDGRGLTVTAFKTGEVIYAPDVSRDKRYVSGTPKTRSEIVFPLRFQGAIMGVLNLESPKLNAFGEKERRLLTAFADRAAMALENARLFELTDAQLRQINILNSITRASLESFDFPIMLAVMADRFRELFQASGCYIALWDDEQQTILPGMGSQIEAEIELHTSPAPGEPSLVEVVLSSVNPIIFEKMGSARWVSPHLAAQYGDHAMLGLPLVVSQQKMGAVILLFEGPHSFTALELRLAEQAAGQVALAIARARSLEASQRRAQEAENLRQATAALAAALDLRQVLDNILDHLEQVIPYDWACVYLLEEQTLHAVAANGFAAEQQVLGYNFPVSNALAQQIMIMGHPLILEDAALEPRFTGWVETGYVHAWMGVPLIIKGSLIGFLTLGSQVAGTYGREQANLAQAFANQAAAAIANARLYSEVQRLAITDPLTGLYNRRGFSEIGHREIERARRYKRPLSVIMLDIDFFKTVNDTYKHAVGDQVLRILAERCRKRTREVDILARYGGEEIVILLPETDRAGGLRAAEHLRRDVAEEPFETDVGPLWVTVSLGVADSLNGECELDELVERADAALYAAKQAGRNRVMSY